MSSHSGLILSHLRRLPGGAPRVSLCQTAACWAWEREAPCDTGQGWWPGAGHVSGALCVSAPPAPRPAFRPCNYVASPRCHWRFAPILGLLIAPGRKGGGPVIMEVTVGIHCCRVWMGGVKTGGRPEFWVTDQESHPLSERRHHPPSSVPAGPSNRLDQLGSNGVSCVTGQLLPTDWPPPL